MIHSYSLVLARVARGKVAQEQHGVVVIEKPPAWAKLRGCLGRDGLHPTELGYKASSSRSSQPAMGIRSQLVLHNIYMLIISFGKSDETSSSGATRGK